MLRSDLEAEAQRLARRWIRLSAEPNGFPPVALWRGPPPSNHRLPQAGAKHLLSMDLERVPAGPVELPLSGVLTLWQAGPREATVQIHRAPILWDAAAASSAVSERKTNPYSGADMGEYVVWPDLETKAVMLYAHEDTSLPAVDDLFRFGGEALQGWLRSLGWDSERGYNDNFPEREVVDAYQRQYLERLWDSRVTTVPVCARGSTFAALGGWPYPMDGERGPEDATLVLTVFASTEPQIELWRRGASFNVVTRLT